MKSYKHLIVLFLFSIVLKPLNGVAQPTLPPLINWNGKSESLIAGDKHTWITPAEKSGFIYTPDYNETMQWLKNLTDDSPLFSMVTIGKSPEERNIFMIIGSSEKDITVGDLKKSSKPLLLVQAGIHSGEIDGKDAGMMLLRDIAFRNKEYLLKNVNLLFIPILNVDGHEHSSPYNRSNQRGPQNTGWRNNSQNLNLNRDYAKLDTKEILAVVNVINDFNPTLYLDIHVTDGADYQYDITFGGTGRQGYSPAIMEWIQNIYTPYINNYLSNWGHIPGPFLNTMNGRNFSQGNIEFTSDPNYSVGYGDARHLPTVVVENHSLKPYKQRVLGTYILIEGSLKLLEKEGISVIKKIQTDRSKKEDKIVLQWRVPQMDNAFSYDEFFKNSRSSGVMARIADSIEILGIRSRTLKSAITNDYYEQWLGLPEKMKIANYVMSEPVTWVNQPRAYWIPPGYHNVIERLKLHGIEMEVISETKEVEVETYRINDARFESMPYEGHMRVAGLTMSEIRKEKYPAGSVRISTNQVFSDLLILLLEPYSPASFFQWGFFSTIFNKTEYIEPYIIEPMALKMLEESPELREEFEHKKKIDKNFAENPSEILNWFYLRTSYYDKEYLLYPVGRELK